MKRFIALLMAVMMIFVSFNVSAESVESNSYKDESIYAVLNNNGSVNNIYVVNALTNIDKDYGIYSSVENLTTLDTLNYINGVVTLPSYDSTFYYQGILENGTLPWNIDITYLLDGKMVEAASLANATGHLVVNIDVTEGNPSMSTFYDTYALQVSMALSNDLSSNIEAKGATIVEAGGSKQIAFTVMPGQGAHLALSADIMNFEMNAISLNGIKMVFSIEVDTSALTDQLNVLQNAISQLDSGAGEILDGLTTLSCGLDQYTTGLSSYTSGMQSFSEGGTRLSSGLAEIATGLNQLSAQSTSLKEGITALEQATFDQINVKLSEMGTQLPTLSIDNYQVILSQDPSLEPILTELEQSLQLTQGLSSYIDGVNQLAEGTTELSYGLDTYVSNASVLTASSDQLYSGAVEINDGLKALRDGMFEYKDGTEKFKLNTADMDEEVQEQIDEMLSNFLGSNEPLTSFVSNQNTDISSVQFFLRTSAIRKHESVDVVDEKQRKYTLWEKLLKLFGLLDE